MPASTSSLMPSPPSMRPPIVEKVGKRSVISSTGSFPCNSFTFAVMDSGAGAKMRLLMSATLGGARPHSFPRPVPLRSALRSIAIARAGDVALPRFVSLCAVIFGA